ncbi:TetR family transcriptional regulator [Kitasatospora sp. SUK 42]|uniref:TetR/AcrR family transcriptional regulator n=1 Tax=Kitasatospora sp. SUK 42 TaxID=1588882 RepID=UPI001C3199ED|nr:TetR family transcriptional regulator [Kitasatospora sp. SUK 42]MBV2156571.1 TetR family transcriptional regulator [Kitasatospora sp. SUK 42]
MQTGKAAEHNAEAQTAAASSRQWLIEVTQREIAERGCTGVSMRSIAARAQVDPSLVRHYFGSKQQLLSQAMNVSLDIDELVAEALRGTPAGVGRRTVKLLLDLCDSPATAARTLVGFAAPLSAAEPAGPTEPGEPGGGHLLPLFRRISEQVSPDQHELRASLVSAQMLALVLGRYLIHDPALTGSSRQDLARIVGRTVQDCLTGPLPSTESGETAA